MNRTIHIAGGGLSGLALGIGLRRNGVPVVLMDAGTYPRHRVCGEFLTGLAPELIEDLDLGDCLEGALVHRTVAWYQKGKAVNQYSLPTPALGISRYCLDQRMANKLRKMGGTLVENHPVGKVPGESWILATGRRPQTGGMVGLKGHWRMEDCRADLELHLGQQAYLGISLVEDGYTNVCGLFKDLAPGRFTSPMDRLLRTLQLHGLGYLVERLRCSAFRPGSLQSVTGLSYKADTMATEVALGDRNGLIPPFTGNGMALALESARFMLPSLLHYARGHCDWEAFLRALTFQKRTLGRRQGIATRLHPFILRPVLQSLLICFSRLHLLPFSALYRFTH